MRASRYTGEDTIVVASSGRGGSTWLAEIVATLPGSIMIWEPLHLENNPDCKRYGFDWQNYIAPGTESLVKRAYLERLFCGRELSTRTLTSLHLDLGRFLTPSEYIVKFVNANMMLPWLTEQFPLRTVLLVRHPCAVVASQLVHGAWARLTRSSLTIPEGLFDDYPHFAPVYDTLSAPEEVLAFEWALQTHVPLSYPTPHPWLLVTYEVLVENGPAEVDRLFSYLGKPVPAEAYERLRTASATTVSDSNVVEGKNPLTGWQARLKDEQVRNVLRVVGDMGVDYYNESIYPDLKALPGYKGSSLSTSREKATPAR